MKQSNFRSTTSLSWSPALHLLFCFSQEKPLRWKEINTHIHTRTKNKTFFVSTPPTCWNVNSSFWRLKKNKWMNKIEIITKLKLHGVYKTLLTNPCQICTHWFSSFRVDMIMFLDFQDFLIYLARYFWSALMFFALFFSNFSQG